MPTFSNHLPPEGIHKGFDLKRTPCSGSLQAIITCDELTVCDTHFWHGRTCPCERTVNDEGKTTDDSSCPACLEKIGFRTHVYVSAFDVKRREHFIFECTANAAKSLAEYREANISLRGCIMYASRPKGTKNSKVDIVTNTANLAKVILPSAPDIVRALSVIWRIPLPALDSKLLPDGARKLRTVKAPLDRMRNQPDNVQDPPTVGEIISGNGQSKKGVHAK